MVPCLVIVTLTDP